MAAQDEARAKLINEKILNSSLASAFYEGLDPMMLHPEFTGAPTRTKQLLHHASTVLLRMFDSWKYWRQAVVSSAAAFTGYSVLASVHLDMLFGVHGESTQTLAAKGQAIKLINKRLLDPDMQFDDVTMLAVTAMYAVEMLNGETTAQQAHIRGVDLMIERRGGPQRFINKGGLAIEIVRSHVMYVTSLDSFATLTLISNVLYVSILNELQPPAFWTEFWNPIAPDQPLPNDDPVSPLHCPNENLHTLLSSASCSSQTYAILADVKNLVNLATSTPLESPDTSAKIRLIYTRFLCAPSAADPDASSQVRDDWIYECCRLAAQILASALFHRVQFSIAAQLLRNTDTPAHPVQMWAALAQTPLNEHWPGMFGVLVWIALTGAAAAKDTGGQGDAVGERARRWLGMTAGSCMSVLHSEHAWAFRANLLRLVEMQKVLGAPEWDYAEMGVGEA